MKASLRRAKLPVAPFVGISRAADLQGALRMVGGKGVLKTSLKGGFLPVKVNTDFELGQAWESFGGVACILESFLEIEHKWEVSCAAQTTAELENSTDIARIFEVIRSNFECSNDSKVDLFQILGGKILVNSLK